MYLLLLLLLVSFFISEKVDAVGFLGKSSVDDLDPFYEHVIKMVAPKMGLELYDFIYGENLTDDISNYFEKIKNSGESVATFTSVTDHDIIDTILNKKSLISTYSPIVYLEEDVILIPPDVRNEKNLAFIKHGGENTEFDTFCTSHSVVKKNDCVYIAENIDLLIKSLELSGSLDIITLIHHLYDKIYTYGDEEIMLVDNNYISTNIYIKEFDNSGNLNKIIYEIKATYSFEPEGNYGEMRDNTCDFLLFLEDSYIEYDKYLPIPFIQIMNSFENKMLRDFLTYLINTLNNENV